LDEEERVDRASGASIDGGKAGGALNRGRGAHKPDGAGDPLNHGLGGGAT
jgi:hypothetical protein